jgi:hypothetical protein
MSRRPALTVQADIARAIRAAKACGAGAVEVKPDGTIRIELSQEITGPEKPQVSVEPRPKVVL